jgi:hypothetical protein
VVVKWVFSQGWSLVQGRGEVLMQDLGDQPGNAACYCQEGPWLRPNRFFVSD